MIAKIKSNLENYIAIFSSFIVSQIFLFNSPLHPWIGGVTGTDSSVYKTIALMMENGYMPYKDSFDHKGPFIYILNYIGNAISYYRGIWVIEVVSLTIAIFFMYKIARISCKQVSSVLATLLALGLLFTYFEMGNMTEEFAMPCIAFSIFVFMDYLINKRLTKVRVVLAGISLGIVLMLRANMIAVWIVFCIFILIKCLLNKDYKNLRNIVLWFFLGVFIVIIPIILWLFANDALLPFWNDYIVFNFQYTSDAATTAAGGSSFSAKWQTFINFSNTTVYLMGLFGILYALRNKINRDINIVYLVYVLGTMVLMAISGMQYLHYGMILIPALVYPLSLAFYSIENIEMESVKSTIWMLAGIYCISVMIMPDWLPLISTIPKTYETKDYKDYYNDNAIMSTVNYIGENTTKNETISVFGNWDIIYVLSNRKHATRYSYQSPIGYIMPDIMESYFNQLQNELPRIIVVQAGYMSENIQNFVNANNYVTGLVADGDDGQSATVYIR